MVWKGKGKPKAKFEDEDYEDEIEISTSGNSFWDVVMLQVKKVTTVASVEFRGGYYDFVTNKKGEEKEVYVPDTREVFSNSVYILALLLKPKFEKLMEGSFNNFKEKIKTIENDFIKKSSVDEEVILGESFYGDTKDKVLLETYKNKKLKLYLALFDKISALLAGQNYGQIGGSSY